MNSQIFKSFLAVFVLVTSIANSQDFQGEAVYQTKTTLNIDFASAGVPADRVKRMKERMKNELEKIYTLTFSKTESIYKEEQTLSQADGGRPGGGGGVRFMMMNGGVTGDYYKNIQTKTSTKESEFSGKNFLIKDSLVTYNWKMEQETKMIGENLCFKATAVVEMPKKPDFKFGRREDNEKKDEGDKKEEEPEKIILEPVIVTAWYALEIPVSQGPSGYWGLPGLILEVSYADTNIMCTKIVLNPKEKKQLKEPKKGKVVTQNEYDTILKEKMVEMRERFQNERQKSGNNGHFRSRG